MRGFSFRVRARFNHARAGELATPHGMLLTPTFMPVGTHGAVKSLTPDDLLACGAQIILANTYHLYLRPGEQLIWELGGLHEFMRWERPILTDSGGYQVSSLGLFLDERKRKFSRVDEEGVTFWSHLDGSEHRLTPEKSVEIQEKLGADIIMAFDEATPVKDRRYAKEAMERTHRWLLKSVKRWRELEKLKDLTDARLSRALAGRRNSNVRLSSKSKFTAPQALFGIVQGGNYRDLRRQSAEFVVGQDLPGIALGGASIGHHFAQTEENISWVRDVLPADKPLYLMGVGTNPYELIEAIASGADMFDCVAPTRLARMGLIYSGNLLVKKGKRFEFVSEFSKGRFNLANKRFRNDARPLDLHCTCPTCRAGFSRAYLRHLFIVGELVYFRLTTLHNVHFMLALTRRLRELILGSGAESG